MAGNLALLLLAIGSLSAVSARPFTTGYKQDADEQTLSYLPYYPFQQDQDVNEQGYRFSIPQNTAKKEGSVSFDWAKQQYLNVPFADQQGIRFTYPQNQATAKQQIISYPYYTPFARKAGWSISLPQQQSLGVTYNQAQQQGIGYNQGIRVGWPQKQDDSNEQSYQFQWPQQQGFTVNIPQEVASKEWFNPYYTPQVQADDAEKEGFSVSVGWLQGQEQSQTGEEQGIGLSYRWPLEKATQEGIRFTYPQQQTSTAKKEGITVSFPQEQKAAKAQRTNYGVNFNWPQQLEKATQEDLSEIIEKLLAEKE